jgi:drug/metabolite transporter (DMT)-like permease
MWQWYAVIAMACFAAMQLLFAHVTRKGLAPPVTLLLVFGLGALLYLLHVRATRTPLHLSLPLVSWLVLVAVLSYIGNLFSVRAIAAAPNPGYAVAVVSVQAAVVTLGGILLLGASFSWIKTMGVLLCCAGIALLVS